MLRVRNRHTASIEGIARGGEGNLPDSPPVRKLIDGGLLELLSDEPGSRRPAPTLEEGELMIAEINRRGARIAELEARVAELEAAPKASRGKKADETQKPAEG